ncbi:hypothetical protein K439DRAFT_1064409 [Ramaria rubella]|nr:hypothetical protein K439DRAFT_1064409 [Ramaria rubella]
MRFFTVAIVFAAAHIALAAPVYSLARETQDGVSVVIPDGNDVAQRDYHDGGASVGASLSRRSRTPRPKTKTPSGATSEEPKTSFVGRISIHPPAIGKGLIPPPPGSENPVPNRHTGVGKGILLHKPDVKVEGVV